MNKKIFVLILCIFMSFFLVKVDASSIIYDDANTRGYKENSSTTSDLGYGTTYEKSIGETIKSSESYGQQAYAVTQFCDGTNSKVVSWAIADGNSGFIRKNVGAIAEDYEAKHPGWKVVAGINSDQYTTKFGAGGGSDGSDYFTPQTYYPFVSDGDKLFAKTVWDSKKYVGFANDGSIDSLINKNIGNNSIKGLFAYVYNENNEFVKTFEIKGYNQKAENNESSLWTPYTGSNGYITPIQVNAEGDVFVVGNADLAYASNSETYTYKPNATNAFFGKGVVSSTDINALDQYWIFDGITSRVKYYEGQQVSSKVVGNDTYWAVNGTSTGIIKSGDLKETKRLLAKGQFVIETNNIELKNTLKAGNYVKVQYDFIDDEINSCLEGVGYHTAMRIDNEDVVSTQSYDNSPYPRSIFGRKADGSIVLVSIDGKSNATNVYQSGAGTWITEKGVTGTDQGSANAILKSFGVVEAYQMDGGGSVQMYIRSGDKFACVNTPSEGSPRSVLCALLFVYKDLDVELDENFSELTSTSIKFAPVLSGTDIDKIEKAQIQLNDKTYEINGSLIEIDNLKPNTTYNYTYKFMFKGKNEYVTSLKSGTLKTLKNMFTLNSIKLYYLNDDVYAALDVRDPNVSIQRSFIVINDKNYIFDNKITKIGDYIEGMLSNYSLVIIYNLNNEEKKYEDNQVTIYATTQIVYNYQINKISERINNIYD